MQKIDKALTTAEVPAEFLRSVFLVGPVPQKALAHDPRVSYSLYVPPQHYSHDPSRKLSLLVSVHGTGRGLHTAAELAPFADSTACAIAFPLFPAGLEGPNDLDSYKLMATPSLRSDLALLAMLDEIAHRWPGIETRKVCLMGFSGGGQFAHRFLYLHPERLAAVSVGAPGNATHLDLGQDWPAGIANITSLFGRSINTDLIRLVAIQLVIGADDVEVHGGKGFWAWASEMKKKRNMQQGTVVEASSAPLPAMEKGRVETMKELEAEWRQHGITAQLDVVPGAGHNASDPIRASVLDFLRPLLVRQQTCVE